MTAEEWTAAGVPVAAGDAVAALRADAALDWLAEHTTLEFDRARAQIIAELPACAKIFVLKFSELIKRKSGLASQSIEGLSQSFDAGGGVEASVWALTNALLSGYVKSQVRVFPARKKW